MPMWKVSFDHGPHMSVYFTVKAESEEKAVKKAYNQGKKIYSSLMLNWVVKMDKE